MNVKMMVSAFVILALCFVQEEASAKPITPDYSRLEQNSPVVSSGQGGGKDAQKSATNLNKPTTAGDNYCEVLNVQSAAMNAGTPATLDKILDEIENSQSPNWVVQPPEKSIWHNLREGLVTDTFDQRLQIAVMSKYEFDYKPRNEWKYLDPTWPNIKFTEKNGHREVVYNIKTRKKVDSGINQATANFGPNPISGAHVFDIANWIRCSTPTERQNELGKILAANPEFINASEKMMDGIADMFNLDPLGLRQKLSQLLEKKKSKGNSMDARNINLQSINLDDPNGDWCKCSQPGCSANMDVENGYVLFGCTKCNKINVKYAKMALELEQKMVAAGRKGEWCGPNAEANAHRAASDK